MGTRENVALEATAAQRLVAHAEGRSGPCPGVKLETVAAAVVIISTEGRVLAANARAEQLLGHGRGELIGRPVEELLHCPGADGAPHDYASQLGVEYFAADGHARAIHRMGHELTVEVMLSPDLAEGAVIAVIRDLSSIDEAARIRDEDVAALGHDLRGPLSVIALEVAMLEDKLPVQTRSGARRALTRIGRNLAFLDRMLHDLLDLAAIDAARLNIQLEQIELSGLITDVIERIVSTRDLPRFTVDVGSAVMVLGDAARLERVVCNLVQNALKYSPPDSGIAVRLDLRGDHVRVSVIDAGPGLAPDEASRVFERFVRGRRAGQHDGVGLGLYVSRKIVEAHRGRIGVESVFGKGSRFYFDLPIVG